MKLKPFLPSLMLGLALVLAWPSNLTFAEPTLNIGDRAPALDIEHWISLGNGRFDEVKTFEDGKVYVVEFWATWCGPCVGAMPRLAELQERYAGNGVQIISITDESLDEVKALLGDPYPNPEIDKTFAEITSSYSLTSDPDGSSHVAYMEAAEARGIPQAFLVGKSGLIEWSGHPMELEGPLEGVLNDTWDREAYLQMLEEQRRFEENMTNFDELVGSGKIDDAIEFASEIAANSKSENQVAHWTNLKNNVKLFGGRIDDDTISYYRNQFDAMKEAGNLRAALSYGNMFYGIVQQGGKVGPLGKDLGNLIVEMDAPEMKGSLRALYHLTLARLYELQKRYAEAASEQELAIQSASEREAKRMRPYLDELKKAAGIPEPEAVEEKEVSDVGEADLESSADSSE